LAKKMVIYREGGRAGKLELALPIGPGLLRKITPELGLEGCFSLHPTPFRKFGGAWRSALLSVPGEMLMLWNLSAVVS
jgi:hypothetical protein